MARDVLEVKFRQELAYNGSGDLEYVGLAYPGTATSLDKWRIMKLIYSSGDIVQILFADGNTSLDNIWDNRASLSYS